MYKRQGQAGPTDLVLQLPGAGGTWSPLVKYNYVPWLKGRIAAMGLDPSWYFCHSFRHGAISLALLHHSNVTLIKLYSNHVSDAILTYSQIPPEKRTDVYKAMLDAVHSHATGVCVGRDSQLR